MSELGTRLREARVNKGYTLNTLQQMTKIQKKYLQAMEEGQMDELPGTFYARAFVKQYADMVGLDGDFLLREYEKEIEVPTAQQTNQEPTEDVIPSRFKLRHVDGERNRIEKLLSYIPLMVLSAIIIFIILVLFYAMRQLSNDNQDPAQANKPSTTVVETVEPSKNPTTEQTLNPTKPLEESTEEVRTDNQIKVGRARISQLSEEGNVRTFQLEGKMEDYEFGAEGKSFVWFGVYEDDALVLDQTINAEEKATHKAKPNTQTVRLELGYPEGANFTVNGKVIETDPSVPNTLIFKVKEDQAAENLASEEEENITPAGQDQTTTGFQGPAVLDPNNSSEG